MSRNKNWPTIISYIVADIIFVLVAAWAVMYAMGYRVDFKDWSVHKTGVLAISTKPSGATVYINDKKYPRLTPITLRNMLPGDYTIKLSLDKYRPFTKSIQIASREVTEEHNLDLILEKITPEVVAQDAGRIISVGNEPVYFNKSHKLVRAVDGKGEPINLDRLPTNVKSVLNTATDIYLAKKTDSGNAWTLGVTANARKWLVVGDVLGGYQAKLFSSPLNQLTAEGITWIGSDKFMGLLGSTLYAVDLTQNKINMYTKSALGVGFFNSKIYIVSRGTNGSINLLRDSNLFDDKKADIVVSNLPVGRSYNLLFANDERIILTTQNGTATGLWLANLKSVDEKVELAWIKVVSNISGVAYEHSNIKPKLVFTSDKELGGYDFTTKKTKRLKTFSQNVKLLGKREESLFLNVKDQLFVSDTAGVNVYEITSVKKASVFLGDDSRRIWILRNNELAEWTLRENTGIFGNVTNWSIGLLSTTAR